MKNRLLIGFLCIMAILLALIYSMVPHVGDDVGYGSQILFFSDKFNGNEFLIYPYLVVRHWFFINGRMSDKLLIGFLHWCPDWLIAIFTSFFWIVTAVIILRLINSKNLLLNTFVLAFLWIGMPMWDSSLLTAVAFNYVWAAAFGLIVAYIVISAPTLYSWSIKLFLILFSFCSGMMHEAMSLPLFAGFVTYLFIRILRQKESIKKFFLLSKGNFNNYVILAFGLGVLCVILSPGIIKRFLNVMGGFTPDDPAWLIFLKSDFLIIPLAISIFILYLKRKSLLNELAKSYWIIFVVAAIVSAGISAISGIVGRSGWFSQIYSLIALGIIVSKLRIKEIKPIGLIASCLILGFVIFCYSNILYWQQIRIKEYNEVMTDYLQSKNGIVYYDYYDDYEMPWYTLGMTLGVPDPDDTFSIYNIEFYLGNEKPFIVLPTVLKSWDGNVNPPALSKGFISSCNISNWEIDRISGKRKLYIYKTPDSFFTVTPFVKNNKEFFYVRPLDLDLGDRLH